MTRPARAASAGAAAAVLCCALALVACVEGNGHSRGSRPTPAGAGGGADASGAGGADGGTGGAGRGELPEPDVDAILEAGCATSTDRARLLPSNLLFVIDRSSSMACNPPPTTLSADCEADSTRANPFVPSKWEITRAALVEAIEKLPAKTAVGISYFSNDDACGVHSVPSVGLAPLDDAQKSAIRASLSTVSPGGATPIVGAVILAYRHLHAQAVESALDGNKFVVLLIDSEAPKAAGPGVWIKTFVIGAPGSEGAKSVLSRLALAGGTAKPDCDPDAGDCHFDMTTQASFADGLASALASIAGRAVLSCELSMPSSDDDVDITRVNVVYSPGDGSEPEVVPQDDRLGCYQGADGWQYADGETKIRLCGPACEAVRMDHGARLDVVLGCPVRGPD